MAEVLDCRGLKCPQPVLKTAIKSNTLPAGTTLEVHADCPSFPDDITKWCSDSGKVLVSIVDQGGFNVATVQL
ncbi:sulfurtransferase TusA family protein [Fibrobacterota bacterium]